MFLLYFIAFCLCAIAYIILESINKKDIIIRNETIQKLPSWSMVLLKGIPAILAFIFAFTSKFGEGFAIGITLGLVFCLIGDIGIETSFISGMIFFSIAQIVFIVTYSGQAMILIITTESMLITSIVAMTMIIYVFLILKYLQSSKSGLGKFKLPVVIYSLLLAFHFCSTVLLWTTSPFPLERAVIILGALFFVISDTMIAIREFHHHIEKSTIKIMTTYYIALLFISSSVLVF
ncbi:MAG: lysoplasmalogenase [Candidatus Hodarchaeales archaeon]|jgi:uncharacterized membrane protein YhhN